MKDILSEKITDDGNFEGKQLYFGLKFSRAEVFFRRLERLLTIFLRTVLFIGLAAGILSLLNHLWLVSQSGLSYFSAKAWRGEYLTYFWWSLVGGMYLFYSFGKNAGKNLRVLKKSFILEKTSRRLLKIDIAKSYSNNLLKILDKAYLSATKKQQPFDDVFIFEQLVKNKKLANVFGRLGISRAKLFPMVESLKNDLVGRQGSPQINAIFLKAYLFAYQEKKNKVGLPEMLKAVTEESPLLQDLLLDLEVTPDEISNVVKWININQQLLARYKSFKAKSYYKPKGVMDRAMTALATPVLDSFSEDLTALARAGHLPLSVAREKEMAEIFNIIQGGRNSVVLSGLPGVGKTNVVEGFANAMVAEEVPKILKDKRLVALSVSSLVAGATKPGALEQRLMTILNEITRARNIILHIDNIHNLVGVTSVGSENVELAEMFASFLSNKKIITLSTTTPSDYQRYLINSTLGQSLVKVDIDEPDDNRAIQMVEAKIGYLESKNKVYFSYDALDEAVKLTRRFVPDHYLPEKAMKILEEVAIEVGSQPGKARLISGEKVAGVISRKTGIPLTQVSRDESEKLLHLEEKIHQRMVNQEEAVNFVASALKRARAELRDESRPIVNLLFLGPTGVGKTELAKTVASIYFGSEDNMIRLDMSEYQLKDSINRLIGTRTAGEGGELKGEGGVLTEAIKKKPFSLVLLDEIEKAHPDILNLFLQIMEDGRLTDSLGRTVSFDNAIIIATSNAGTQFLQDNLRQGKSLEEIKNQLMMQELKQDFRPEFLNRFDGVVIFKPLSKEHIFQIAGLMLGKVRKRLEDKGIYLTVTEGAQAELAEAGFDPTFGARPLRRVIQERVDNALANYLLQGKISRRDQVILEAGGNIRVKKAKKF